MNAIVAIGGAALFRVVAAYRALVPSVIWVLGVTTPRDPNDPLVRSLEILLEPFMETYFAAEVQAKVAEQRAHWIVHPLPAMNSDAQGSADAVCATLEGGLASAMALVIMLDRAHALEPIELVVTDDGTAPARTAVAWACARGLPVVSMPDRAPLGRPPAPDVMGTIVVGERARQAYDAIDFNKSLLAVLPPPDTRSSPDEVAAGRSAARAAFTQALGWSQTDIVVVFNPCDAARASALEPADAPDVSLAAMFAGFVVARAALPTLRVAVVRQPSADGLARARQLAALAGLAPNDFAYAQADHDVWTAGADILVSEDSTRSIEAAVWGVPAVNLWRPANWYLGPAFAAEDGVIDASPRTLGASLVALANDAGLRAQIAAIARDRLARDAPASAPAVAALARELVKRRRPIVIATKPKPDIVLWAPNYSHTSGGIRALYRLCHFINLAGGNASMHAPTILHPTWNAPRRDMPITERTIVVIPEIVFGHPSIKRVVRWVLNKPGLLGGPATYGPEEMVFYYAQAFRAAAQAATAELLTDERELPMSTVEPELFFNDRSRPRLYDCVYVGKGEAVYQRMRLRETRDALVIRGGAMLWPASRMETAALLRGCRRLYSFDQNTAIVTEAVMCGVQCFYVRESGALEEHLVAPTDISDYVQHYYDLADVERFLRLITERWD